MKKNFLLLLFFSISLCFSQPGFPPYFKIEYEKLNTNNDSILKDLQFSLFCFESSVEFEKGKKEKWEVEEGWIKDIDSKFINLYVYSEYGKRLSGNIFRLNIIDKSTDKIMSLFIWHDNLSEETKINNLTFKEGNYFFDYYVEDSKYKGFFIRDYAYLNYTLDVQKINQHKISLKKLNKILKKRKSKDDK